MFFGIGTTSSVIHAAGASGGGVRARPNTLVLLVKTNARTPAAAASSSSVSVPVTLVSTNACLLCVAMCGLCSVAVWITASTPLMHRLTNARSATDPTAVVNADDLRSMPIGSSPAARSTRISASPRCPAVPVMRSDMRSGSGALRQMQEHAARAADDGTRLRLHAYRSATSGRHRCSGTSQFLQQRPQIANDEHRRRGPGNDERALPQLVRAPHRTPFDVLELEDLHLVARARHVEGDRQHLSPWRPEHVHRRGIAGERHAPDVTESERIDVELQCGFRVIDGEPEH